MQHHKHIPPTLSNVGILASRSLFRHDRFFHVMNEGWYIEVRDRNLGPFPTHEIAEQVFENMIAKSRKK